MSKVSSIEERRKDKEYVARRLAQVKAEAEEEARSVAKAKARMAGKDVEVFEEEPPPPPPDRELSDLPESVRQSVALLNDGPQTVVADHGDKEIIAMTALWERFNSFKVCGALIVTELRFVDLWERERRLWKHLENVGISRITESPDQRRAGMIQPTQIKIVNYENLSWLVDELILRYLNRDYQLPFNALVIDDMHQMGNPATKRVKQLKLILPWFHYKMGFRRGKS